MVDISELETTVEGDKATMRFRQRLARRTIATKTRKTLAGGAGGGRLENRQRKRPKR